MKKILLVIIVWIAFGCSMVYAQKRGTIYTEIFGNSFIYSINYDFRFDKRNEAWGGKIGFSYLVESFICPLHINYLIGPGAHKLELGGGILFLTEPENNGSTLKIAGSGALMYRYHNPGGHLYRRRFTNDKSFLNPLRHYSLDSNYIESKRTIVSLNNRLSYNFQDRTSAYFCTE